MFDSKKINSSKLNMMSYFILIDEEIVEVSTIEEATLVCIHKENGSVAWVSADKIKNLNNVSNGVYESSKGEWNR